MAKNPLWKRAEEFAVRYRDGDGSVTEEIFQVHKDLLYPQFQSWFGSKKAKGGMRSGYIDADDGFQVFMGRLWPALRRYQEGNYRAYARTIARNAILDVLGRGDTYKPEKRKEGDPDPTREEKYKRAIESEEEGAPSVFDAKPDRTEPYMPLIIRAVLNDILAAVRRLAKIGNTPARKAGDHADAFVFRILLGFNEKDMQGAFGWERSRTANNFARGLQAVLEFLHDTDGYAEISLAGLKEVCKQRFRLSDRDLETIKDESERRALEPADRLSVEASGNPVSWEDFAYEVGLPVEEALALLRRAICSLAKARLRRRGKKPPAELPQKADAWLWEVAGEALKSFPLPRAVTRDEAPAEDLEELAHLAALSVQIMHLGTGSVPVPSFGQLLMEKIPVESIAEEAGALGLSEDGLEGLLCDQGLNLVDDALLKKIEARYGITREVLERSLEAPLGPSGALKTRSLSAKEKKMHDRWLRETVMDASPFRPKRKRCLKNSS